MVISVHEAEASPQVVSTILRGLEPWFGIEEYTRQYIAAANRLPNYLALDDLTGEPVGVILVEQHFPHSAEIHLMAVKAERHRQGIGHLLLSTVERDLWQSGTRLLTVKTLGPSRADMNYEATRRFYEVMGFLPVQEFLDLWPEDPCLLMIKPLLRGLDTPSKFASTAVSDADTILRAFRDDDCSALADAFADPDIRSWNPGPAAEEGETAIRAWMSARNDWSNGSHTSWAISDPSGALLGSVSLHKIDLEQADAEVGYWVA